MLENLEDEYIGQYIPRDMDFMEVINDINEPCSVNNLFSNNESSQKNKKKTKKNMFDFSKFLRSQQKLKNTLYQGVTLRDQYFISVKENITINLDKVKQMNKKYLIKNLKLNIPECSFEKPKTKTKRTNRRNKKISKKKKKRK